MVRDADRGLWRGEKERERETILKATGIESSANLAAPLFTMGGLDVQVIAAAQQRVALARRNRGTLIVVAIAVAVAEQCVARWRSLGIDQTVRRGKRIRRCTDGVFDSVGVIRALVVVIIIITVTIHGAVLCRWALVGTGSMRASEEGADPRCGKGHQARMPHPMSDPILNGIVIIDIAVEHLLLLVLKVVDRQDRRQHVAVIA